VVAHLNFEVAEGCDKANRSVIEMQEGIFDAAASSFSAWIVGEVSVGLAARLMVKGSNVDNN